MRIRNKILIYLFLSFQISCTSLDFEITERPYPRLGITTTTPQEIGVILENEVIFSENPITDHGFIWEYRKPFRPFIKVTHKVSLGNGELGKFDFKLDTLKSGKLYLITAYVKSLDYQVFSEPVEFTPQ